MMQCTAKRRNGGIIVVLLLMIAAIIAVILCVVLIGNDDNGSSSNAAKELSPPPSLRPVSSSPPTLAPISPNPSMLSTTLPTAPATFEPSITPTPTSAPSVPTGTLAPSFAPTISPTASPSTASPSSSPTLSLLNLLSSVALQGGDEFDDVGTHQSLALRFLQDTSAERLTAISVIQRYALACIYFGTLASSRNPDLAGWNRDDGWVSEDDECTWQGVTCNENGQVSALDLADNNVAGSFVEEIILLKDSLVRLDLTDNPTFSDNGYDFLGQLDQLQELLLVGTNFAYDEGIPTEIGLLTQLTTLDCSFTLFTGELRGSVFEKLSNLKTLVLSGNQYDSSVPQEIGQLERLQVFEIEQADLVGDLAFMSLLRSDDLTEIMLDKNPRLGGELPAFSNDLESLQKLSLSNCNITGQIPSEIQELKSMVELDLSSNQLLGFIPEQVGEMTSLKRLLLQDNNLGGFMPGTVCERVANGTLATLEADCVSEVFCECCSQCF